MVNPYDQCTFKDHYGPNYPVNPSLRPNSTNIDMQVSTVPSKPHGCSASILMREKVRKVLARAAAEARKNKSNNSTAAPGECHQLNGVNLELSKLTPLKHFDPIPDVKVQFIPPTMPCDPCDVTYSVSAAISEDEYIGVGFKGESWEARFPIAPWQEKRPCYFGMCVDKYDSFASDRIAIGYAGGSATCFREMVSRNIVGAPVDVPADSLTLKDTAVTRQAKRTVLKFTVSQHWNATMPIDGPWRIMWAIGSVTPGATACTSTLGYHTKNRGVAPLLWLQEVETGGSIGSTACKYSPTEMDF
jgi:hypothetical protein